MVYVLVHSPLLGPSSWELVAERLRSLGHDVTVPDLRAGLVGEPPYAQRMGRLAADAALANPSSADAAITLVAHSGAGLLLPSVLAGLPTERVRAAILVDALLPRAGQSWFDTVPAELLERLRAQADGDRLAPWHQWFPSGTLESLVPDPVMLARIVEEVPRVPLTYAAESVPAVDGWPPAHRSYIRLSEGYDDTAVAAGREGWQVVRRDLHHLAPLTNPVEVADLLLAP